MIEALLTLLPTPMMLPPSTSVVPSEFAIACGVDIVSDERLPAAPCPAACPCRLAAFAFPPVLNDELPNDELLPVADCEPPNEDPNPPLLPLPKLEFCPSGVSGRLFRLPISCPFGAT